ncbi:MAG: bifunctional homocysteine S-methyltransferase/methylenetetrahydrofolate reductase [Spirochaetes bacterium]|nr:bifunctional homocysteine S-methyltransferase/methylenetetrahydrofolate reductase [Spirochaetota bacterium]
MSSYLARIRERITMFDGAMGTMLYQKGVFVNACYDELSLTRPDLVREVHREYAEAGADIILTNTFGANRIKLREYGLAERVEAVNAAAVKLAREAAPDALIAGDVGPCSRFAQPLVDSAAKEFEAAFEEQMRILKTGGVDFIFLETFSDLAELALAAKVAKSLGLTVHASFTVNDNGESAVGFTAEKFVTALEADANVDTVGLNCSIGPAGVFDILERIIKNTTKPFVVKPNAGMPREVNGRMLYMTSPEYFTEYAKRFVELGARGVGGCCGTTPAHIREAAKALRGVSGARKQIAIKAATVTAEKPVTVVPTGKKSRFGAKLSRGEWVTSIEILPPKSANMNALYDKVRDCHFAGIDAINIPDGPRASSRVSPMVTAILIKNTIGIEPIPHYCCRDRNLLGMQSDILGAQAAGLTNMLIITGDPPKTGDYPDVTGVFDVDSIGLTQLVTNLNHGRDFGGNFVDPPSSILIGVGANPCAVDGERELSRYFKKIEAGAEYAITQPVFDAELLLRFLDNVEKHEKRIPVIAGIWPLASYKNAEFMRNEVPGVVIPDVVMSLLSKCKTKEDSREAGIEISRAIIGKIKDRIAGVQVSAPMGNVQTALAVLS